MSAVSTERLGNFLKADFEPNVAANLAGGSFKAHSRLDDRLPKETKAAVAFGEKFWRKEHIKAEDSASRF